MAKEIYSGIHTLEIEAAGKAMVRELERYRAALRQEKGKLWRVNFHRLDGWPEYASAAETQIELDKLAGAMQEAGGDQIELRRLDWRIDWHEGAYKDNLQICRAFVWVVACLAGTDGRMIEIQQEAGGNISSIRAMPNAKESGFGLEYYDKQLEAECRKYGVARLEFRRVNIEGGNIRAALNDWLALLSRIDKHTYRAALLKHASSLIQQREPAEPASKFCNRMKPYLMAREEEGLLYKLAAGGRGHYTCQSLPSFQAISAFTADVRERITREFSSQNVEDE